MIRDEPLMDAPIPGQSMLHELGARPWQNPPKYSNVDDAIEYYLERMSSEEFLEQLEDVMEMGIPLTDIANVMQLGGVMEGMHTIDVGILVLPVLVEMMMLVGDSAKIEYDSGLDDKAPMNKSKTRETLVAKTARKLQIKLNEKTDDKPEESKEKDDVKEETIAEDKGLMSRRTK